MGLRGNDGLGARSHIAAPYAVHLSGRPRPDLLQRALALFARRHRQADFPQELPVGEFELLPLHLDLLGKIADAFVEAGDGDLAVLVVKLRQQSRQDADGIGGGSAIGARMQIDARAGDGDLVLDHAAQARGDRRRLLVPHIGVAHECRIAAEFAPILLKKGNEARRARFLFTLDQDRGLERQRAGCRDPGPHRLDKGHELAFVICGAAAIKTHDAILAGAFLRLERRRHPFIQRIGRLHVIVAVEQEMRDLARCTLGFEMRHHHRVAGRVAQRGGEAESREIGNDALGRPPAILLIGRIRRNRGNAHQIEQAVEALVERLVRLSEDSVDVGHCLRRSCCVASPSMMRAQLLMPLRKLDRLYFSFGLCTLSSSRPKPTSRVSILSSDLNVPTTGIEAPSAVRTGSLPHSFLSARWARRTQGLVSATVTAIESPPSGLYLTRQSAGRRALTKSRRPLRIPVGVWRPTRRKVSLAVASAGSTVFEPAPV